MYRRHSIILVFVFIISMVSAAAYAAPKAYLPVLEHDFGTIKEGEKVTHNFKIVNSGDEPLLIEKIKTGCGCTASSVEGDNTVQPKLDSEIKVVYNSARRSGSFTQKVRVHTNDPDNPVTTITIKGVVEAPPVPVIQMVNRQIDMGIIRTYQPNKVSFPVRNTGQQPLVITSITGSQRQNFLSGDVTVPPGETKQIELTYIPQQAGLVKDPLTIYSNDPQQSSFAVFLNGYSDPEDRVIISRKNPQTYVILNNTLEPITVADEQAREQQKILAPMERGEIALSSPEQAGPLSISLGVSTGPK